MPEGSLPSELVPLGEGDPAAIGPFRVVGRLGSGGMGAVYGALDDAGNCVAVKVIHSHLADQEEYLSRFAREVELVRGVDAECAPAFLSADPRSRPPWLATEFVPGRTLSGHVREFGPLSGTELILFAAGTAEALAALHSSGVIHQDIKPGNVILSPSGPKVLDFGIARSVHDTEREHGVAGTPGYLAPERLDGAESSPAADVFAWAAMVVYAATGQHPYPGDTTDAVLARIRMGTPDLAQVPQELLPLVRHGLDRAPESRPSAADAYTDVLDTLVPDTPARQRTEEVPAPRNGHTLPYVPPPGGPVPQAGETGAMAQYGAADPRAGQRARLRQALHSAWNRFDAAGHDPRAWAALAGAHLGAAGAAGGLVAANTGMGAGAGAAAAPVGGTLLGVKTSVAVASATAIFAVGAVGGGVTMNAVIGNEEPEADTQEPAAESEEEDDGLPFDAQEVEYRGLTLRVPAEWEVYPQESQFHRIMEENDETEEWLVLATMSDGACGEDTDWTAFDSADMCEHIKLVGPEAMAVGGPSTERYSPESAYSPTVEPAPCPPGIATEDDYQAFGDFGPLEEDTVQADGTEFLYRQYPTNCLASITEQVYYTQNTWFFEAEEVLVVDDWINNDITEILKYTQV